MQFDRPRPLRRAVFITFLLVTAAILLSGRASAGVPQHEHHNPPPPAPPQSKPSDKPPAESPTPPTAKPEDPHAGHPMSHEAGHATTQPHAGHEASGHAANAHEASAHEAGAMMSTVTGGPFRAMSAIGSGTSLMPASAPGYMWHWMKGDWMLMLHTNLTVGFNHQGGPRGVSKAESQNWLMLMAERQAGGGQLMLRGMFSAEPWTAPRRGFPELFQTGETYKGRPIIDAQHPHDLFMELAAQYTLPLTEHVSINLYGGPVGEPALGPVAFMHRPSAAENPAAVLGHHWQDSTHITHGVFTAGLTAWKIRVEGSIFRGAEPDENRKDIEMGKLDSYSGRVWFTPTPDWTMQLSHGRLTNPELLAPGDLTRTTASIHHNRTWNDGNWATSLIWGRNHETHGNSNAYTFESTVNFKDKNYLYTRLELGDKNGLLQENIWGRAGLDTAHDHADVVRVADTGPHSDAAERWFRVGAMTLGGVRDLIADRGLRVGVGADVTFYHVPGDLQSVYGSQPVGFRLFVRLKPGKVAH